ncbi:hypothetical protein [Mycobacterium sp. ACS1612]|uniref:hypothetical protein n=1 Tax=Mycobacterium sp. ACS1612 TaxID=1834117 RepID=UPI0012EA85A6|nr:hypothetical protein [Mycobacterium sp. ACS1612]
MFALKTGTPFRYLDEQQYFDIAESLVRGRGFELDGAATAYRPPAWPVLLAAGLALGLPGACLPAISAMCMIGAAIAAAYIGIRLTNSRWGSMAGVFVLLYPLNLYTASTLYPQAMATAAFLTLWAIAVRAESPSNKSAMPTASCALVGLLTAVIMLTVPILAFTAFAILGWFWWQQPGNRIRLLLVSGLCAGLLIVPWTVRNEIVLGSPVVFSASAGQNLFVGNNPTATPSSGVAVDMEAAKRSSSGMGEIEKDSYLRSLAIKWISDNKGAAVRLYFGKALNYFSPYNQPTTMSQGGRAEKWAAIASFVLLVAGVTARLVLRFRRPLSGTEKFFLCIFVLNAFVMAVFFTRTRFRQPLDNILIIETTVPLVTLSAMALGYAKARRMGARGGADP